MMLDALSGALEELVGLDQGQLAEGETVVGLYRQLHRLQALVTVVAGRFASGGEWQLDGSRSAAAWLMARCRLPKPAAKADLARARALRHLPATEAAWLAGDIAVSHVRVLVDAYRPRTRSAMDRDEAGLVDYAKTLQFRNFAKAVDYWIQLADPDGAEWDAAGQHRDRRVHLSRTFKGNWVLDGDLDPIGGAIFADELSRLEDQLFKADWAEAKARLGREPVARELARTPQQRRADALVEMAVRSASTPADARRPEPLFTVLVDWPTFSGRVCELDDGTVITPGTLTPWLTSSWVERVVFKSPTRVDVGVAQRLFTGATRRAIEVRDRECFHPTCDVPAQHCQVDHIIPYTADGPTTQDNGRLACGYHNRQRHQPPPDP